MLVSNSIDEKIEKDFAEIEIILNYINLDPSLKEECKAIHKKLVTLKMFLIRFEGFLKPLTATYLNEVISDLIEAYVLLFQDRYKTSKILLRSGVDCLVRGLYIEKVSTNFEKGFTDTLSKLNTEIKSAFSSKQINVGFIDTVHKSIKDMFDNTSQYVHGGIQAELSQYTNINQIISPSENLELKKSHSNQMNGYLSDILFYLILANFNYLFDKCPLNEQNVIIGSLKDNQKKIINGTLKIQYFD
jgi:hypothetical protein